MLSGVATRSQTSRYVGGSGGGSGHRHNAALCLCRTASCGTILPLVHSDTGQEGWSYSPIFLIFPPKVLREKELPFDSSPFPVWPKNTKEFLLQPCSNQKITWRDRTERKQPLLLSRKKSIQIWCHLSVQSPKQLEDKNNPQNKTQMRMILNPDKHDKTTPEMAATFEWSIFKQTLGEWTLCPSPWRLKRICVTSSWAGVLDQARRLHIHWWRCHTEHLFGSYIIVNDAAVVPLASDRAGLCWGWRGSACPSAFFSVFLMCSGPTDVVPVEWYWQNIDIRQFKETSAPRPAGTKNKTQKHKNTSNL